MLPTPPISAESSPSMSPNHVEYYCQDLSKSQFNSILINCAVNLLKIVYGRGHVDETKLRFFVFEMLRRSKTSIQSVQLGCWYLVKIAQAKVEHGELPADSRKLFLACIILASKFNQDYNYSLKTWVKICGGGQGGSFDVAQLRKVEFQTLALLKHELCLNGLQYENWSNILLIFGYDFIATHHVMSGTITWEVKQVAETKVDKWRRFFTDSFVPSTMNHVKVDFHSFYQQQLGSKVVHMASPSLFDSAQKRCRDEVGTGVKRARLEL